MNKTFIGNTVVFVFNDQRKRDKFIMTTSAMQITRKTYLKLKRKGAIEKDMQEE